MVANRTGLQTSRHFYPTLFLSAALWFGHKQGMRTVILLWLSGILAGLYYAVGKWSARSRPTFDNGKVQYEPVQF
jgi:hypothetical protein